MGFSEFGLGYFKDYHAMKSEGNCTVHIVRQIPLWQDEVTFQVVWAESGDWVVSCEAFAAAEMA